MQIVYYLNAMEQRTYEWMTVDEAAAYLRCSERHLRGLIAEGQVPHVEFAGKALFYRQRLDSWLLRMETGGEELLKGPVRKGGTNMNEADMERLIRDYPQEFFDEPLKLVSSQEAFPSGITDLIFEDRQGQLLVVELKRGILQREHVAQLIDYLGDVEARYSDRGVELMVLANVIPPQRRTKLERLGVNFKEIPEIKFREVAKKYSISLSEVGMVSEGEQRFSSSGFGGEREAIKPDCDRARVEALVHELIAYGERFVTGLGKNLKQDLENSGYSWLSTQTYAQLSRWCHPNRYSSREQWVQPRVHEISTLLFGEVISRTPHPSYAG